MTESIFYVLPRSLWYVIDISSEYTHTKYIIWCLVSNDSGNGMLPCICKIMQWLTGLLCCVGCQDNQLPIAVQLYLIKWIHICMVHTKESIAVQDVLYLKANYAIYALWSYYTRRKLTGTIQKTLSILLQSTLTPDLGMIWELHIEVSQMYSASNTRTFSQSQASIQQEITLIIYTE